MGKSCAEASAPRTETCTILPQAISTAPHTETCTILPRAVNTALHTEKCTIQPLATSRGHFQDPNSPLPSNPDSVNDYFLVPVVSYVSCTVCFPCFLSFYFLSFVFILESLICTTDFVHFLDPVHFLKRTMRTWTMSGVELLDSWIPLHGMPTEISRFLCPRIKKKWVRNTWILIEIGTIYKERKEHCPE